MLLSTNYGVGKPFELYRGRSVRAFATLRPPALLLNHNPGILWLESKHRLPSN
jgi:hypothetical protein